MRRNKGKKTPHVTKPTRVIPGSAAGREREWLELQGATIIEPDVLAINLAVLEADQKGKQVKCFRIGEQPFRISGAVEGVQLSRVAVRPVSQHRGDTVLTEEDLVFME